MGDSLDQERPAKRIKLAPHPPPFHQQVFVPPANMALGMTPMPPVGDAWVAPVSVGVSAALQSSHLDMLWPPPPQMLAALDPAASDVAHVGWAPFPTLSAGPTSVPLAAAVPISTAPDVMPAVMPPLLEATAILSPTSSVPLPADFDLTPASQANSLNNPTPPRPLQESHSSRLQLDTAVDVRSGSQPPPQNQRRRKSRPQTQFTSPFKDCVDSFGKFTAPRFPRPSDGNVNGYIKFHWPERKSINTRSFSVSTVTECNDDDDDDEDPGLTPSSTSTGTVPSTALTVTQYPSPESSDAFIKWLSSPTDAGINFSFDSRTTQSAQSSPVIASGHSSSKEMVRTGSSASVSPRMVPPHFGMDAKMDAMDRRFWTFYIMNWCPGRSVLGRTNLWLQDFAKMHESNGVRAAIQSLAGIYIYDYQPIDAIRKRTNQRFSVAESRLSTLLDDRTILSEHEASELITIVAILSMQDIVLTERRLKSPFNPRWLQGFLQSEHFLEVTDQGSRFWQKTNVQLSSLRISQSIIVGRAVILAQPMMALPIPTDFDPEQEARRFGWLLYGTQQDMYEIHGGCGFSKKLLHVMSQITYCAARLQQDRESPVVPMTAKFLLNELSDMRQWSSESRSWETAKTESQTVEWVRRVSKGSVIDSSSGMTDVTAEAWRIAAMLYLQCRALRLPRNHPDVVENLDDLAHCIRIMPTSGSHFTAQAPLFPVFLLGILATVPDHLDVSRQWFESVIGTPVRSSVPPLYEALRRIWSWINLEPVFTPPIDSNLDEHVGNRYPWWERLVLRVREKEQEVLCLT